MSLPVSTNVKKLLVFVLVICVGISVVVNLVLVRSVWLAYSSWTEQLADENNWLLPINKHVELVVRSHTLEGIVKDISLDKDEWKISLSNNSNQQTETHILPNRIILPEHVTLRKHLDTNQPLSDYETKVELEQLFAELKTENELLLVIDQTKRKVSDDSYISGITIVTYE